MAKPFASAFAKIARAEEHRAAVDEEIRRWREENPAAFSGDHNAESTDWRLYIDFESPPNPVRWAVLIGDCIHNLRSALDHVVFELSGPKPPDRCEFPIFADRDRYCLPESNPTGGQYKIRGITNRTVRALIEGAQPWQAPNPTEHYLWLIQQLDIEDKHHLLLPVGTVPAAMEGWIEVEPIDQAAFEGAEISGPEWIALQDHAEFLTVRSSTPLERVVMDFQLTVAVALRLRESLLGVPGVLGETCEATRRLVEQIRDAAVKSV